MIDKEFKLDKKIRWGQVGGGRGSEIGYIHRTSASRDGAFELFAGAFDVDAERGKEFGIIIGLDSDRCYSDYKEMFEKEAAREDGIQAVTIATPNFLHYEICKAALNAGLHIVCEKPLCFTLEEAEELQALSFEKQKIVGVTYGYTGFPMVHQAKKMVENKDIGDVRIINTQFAHGYGCAESPMDAPGSWRFNPKVAGPTYVIGDIGTHALFLAETIVSGLKIKRLLCASQSFVKSRFPMEDNAQIMMECEDDIFVNLWASSVNAGGVHEHKIRVIGSEASLEWWDEYPSQLKYEIQGKPAQVLERGMDYLYLEDEMVDSYRLGSGHAEGLFGAWATLYKHFGIAMDRVIKGEKVQDVYESLWMPNITNGVEGVRFVENCLRSIEAGGTWVDYE